MITPEQEAEVRRLFFGEHLSVGEVASSLGVHRDVVTRVIGSDSFTKKGCERPSALDPWMAFVKDTLQRYPNLTATRLHQMLRQRGYEGSVVQVRRRIAREQLRVGRREAFFEMKVLPGEQGQVDWMHVGHLKVGETTRPVSALVITLSWSRAFWVHFSLDQRVESVLRGHVEAFEHFGGVPRTMLYDNMKTAVIERRGDAVRLHERLVQCAGWYLFSAAACAPHRPNEKGRVERRIRDIRESLLVGQTWSSLDDLRTAFRSWQQEVAYARPHPSLPGRTVHSAFEEEMTHLVPLPTHVLPTDEVRPVVAQKQPWVHYDRNRYSVPPEAVGRPLTLSASADTVRVLDGQAVIATHRRSWGRNERIDEPDHLDALVEHKRRATAARGRDRVGVLFPRAAAWYASLLERSIPMGPQTARLLALLDRYAVEDVREAMAAALERNTPAADSIARLLERMTRERNLPPALPVSVPERVRHLDVRNHDLGGYDDL